jgi:hypothetical protein
LTPEELALLGLRPGDPLPGGGQRVVAAYQSGHGSASVHTQALAPYFRGRWGVELWPGSLNLHAQIEVEMANPHLYQDWMMCPIILEERAVGVVCRKNTELLKFLEVVAPVQLSVCLGLSLFERVAVRVLSGKFLVSPGSVE